MCSLFTRGESSQALPSEPVHADAPELQSAGISAVYYGQRQAGDFYDFIRVHPERVLFALLDAAGGLAETRAIISAVQQTFRTLGPSLFSKDDVNEAEAMTELCLQVNHTILSAEQGVRSCPAFVGCYNEGLGIVCYFNAGHTPGMVRDHTGVTELAATALPFGLFSHTTGDALMMALEPGAALLLVSRGVTEAKHKGEEFGLERVKAEFQRTGAESARELCVMVLDGVRQFMGTAPTHDDVTTLALVRASSKP
jgi:phosphoserine phosphatase RsbU/P